MPLQVWPGHAGVGTGSFDMVSLFVRCLFNHEMVIHKYSIKMMPREDLLYTITSHAWTFSL